MRFVVLALAFLAALELLAIVFLIPSFLLARSKQESIALQVATVDQLIVQREQNEATVTIRDTQHRLRELTQVAHYPNVIDYIERIIAERGEGIVLDGITYQAGHGLVEDEEGDTETQMTISGHAGTRDGLLAFVRQLEHTTVFTNVVLPVSNLAQREGIPFTLHITATNPFAE